MFNYNKIAESLIPIQPMPPGAVPVYYEYTNVQFIYLYLLKWGYRIKSVNRENNKVIAIFSGDDHQHIIRTLEPKDA